jgi:beta-lysine 5,6-aminomutase beta subunit
MSIVRPYGDTTGDGMVQLSFTLPVPAGPRAEAAAAVFASRMGLDPVMVVHAKGVGPDFTFFVVYGRSAVVVDMDAVEVAEREFPLLTAKEVNLEVRSRLGRKLVIVGATVGTDAHTVGLDAILNVKGFAGEKGLEYYRELRVVNLGAQVDPGELVARARDERADALLVSQVVTQRDAHLHHVRLVADRLERDCVERGWPSGQPRPLLVVGGPRFEPRMAAELRADRIFAKGTTPREVASYLVHALSADPARAAT